MMTNPSEMYQLFAEDGQSVSNNLNPPQQHGEDRGDGNGENSRDPAVGSVIRSARVLVVVGLGDLRGSTVLEGIEIRIEIQLI